MTFDRRSLLTTGGGAVALSLVTGSLSAQAYPTAPITIVTPFPAGGPSDTIARLLAERMAEDIGQRVIIENVTGANGSIGVGRVARAAPDGYTLSIGQTGTHVLNGAMYSLQYDLLTDFEPITLLTDSPILLVGKKGLPADNVGDLVRWLLANPGKASAGIPGVGSLAHLCFALFQNLTKTQITLVPYRGVAPAVQDLVAGELDLMITDLISTLPLVSSKSIKALAITSGERLPQVSEIPTTTEVGLPGMEVSIWHGVWAPKGTPKDIIGKLNRALVFALRDENVRARLADLGQTVVAQSRQTPEALAAHQRAEIERWWPIVKATNIKPTAN